MTNFIYFHILIEYNKLIRYSFMKCDFYFNLKSYFKMTYLKLSNCQSKMVFQRMKRNGSKISSIRFDINSFTIKYTIDVAVKYLTTRYISMHRIFHKFISKSVLSLHRILAMFRLQAQALSSS